MNQFMVRPMARSECDLALEWAAEEGWNPGLHDAEAFYAADPNGFFVGLLDGQPISSISAMVLVLIGPEGMLSLIATQPLL